MINKITTIVLFVVFFSNRSIASVQKFVSDSIKTSEKAQLRGYLRGGPFVLPQVNPGPLAFYQNKIYKRRLDSLQKTIPLACNQYVQNYIDLYTSKHKERVGKVLGLSKYYFPIFEKALREVGIPEEIKFITIIESALNPNAVSHAGAKGLWQFMSATAKGYGLQMDNYVDERKDPVQASYAAATYFKDVYNQFGDWLLAIAAYNCGASIVSKAIEKSGGIADFWRIRPYLPKQTQNYVPAFIATNYVMNYYKKHNILPTSAGIINTTTDVIEVNRVVSLANVAKAANLDLGVLCALNPSYKKLIINGSQAKPKQLVMPLLNKQVYGPVYDALNTPEVHKEIHHTKALPNKPIQVTKKHPKLKDKHHHRKKQA